MKQQRFYSRFIYTIASVSVLSGIIVSPITAYAQESEPRFRFDQPSDEMDFTLQPVPEMPSEFTPPVLEEGAPPIEEAPDLYGFGSPPPITEEETEGQQVIDQFFSTTTIIPPDAAQEEAQENIAPAEEETIVEEETAPQPSKPRVYHHFKSYPKPPHRFKSVRLPSEIYHRENTKENKHLPFAYYEQDQWLLLKEAVMQDNVDMLRALYKDGANLHYSNERDPSLLHFAVQQQKPNAVRWLLMYRLDPNQQDQHGFAPLHYAAYAGNVEIIQLLLTYGADKNLSDAHGYTALTYAEQSNHSSISQKLLK